MLARAGGWGLLALSCCLKKASAAEQVLLLSEPGSGAHSFAALLASEAKALRGDEFLITWGGLSAFLLLTREAQPNNEPTCKR